LENGKFEDSAFEVKSQENVTEGMTDDDGGK
jgi:hypothetical protein